MCLVRVCLCVGACAYMPVYVHACGRQASSSAQLWVRPLDDGTVVAGFVNLHADAAITFEVRSRLGVGLPQHHDCGLRGPRQCQLKHT